MTLDEFEKLCNAATPGPWHCEQENADGAFIAASREMVPKLIAVAKLARSYLDTMTYDPLSQEFEPYIDNSAGGRLERALSAVERQAP